MSGIGKSNVFIASQFASCLICDQSIELESDWGLFSSTHLEGTASVQWSSVQTMLEQAKSDVLLLLDYCQAASTIAASGNGVTEIIAACGFETEAPGCRRVFIHKKPHRRAEVFEPRVSLHCSFPSQ